MFRVTLRTNGPKCGAEFTGELPLHNGVTVVYGDVVDDDTRNLEYYLEMT